MSARDHLILAVAERGGSTIEDARRLVDAYAHELAETIRKQTARGNLIRPEFEEAWEAGLDRAADLIEPRDGDGEAKYGAGPVRPDEEPTTKARCSAIHHDDRRCELAAGHTGLHNNNDFFGLSWSSPNEEPT